MTDTDPRPTPPPELVEKWVAEIWHEGTPVQVSASDIHIATQAARWGADQRLEACCEWLHWQNLATHRDLIPSLRAAMRPQPPLSDKQRALKALEAITTNFHVHGPTADAILHALEQLPEGPAVTPAPAPAPAEAGGRPLWELMQDAAAEAEDGVSDMGAPGYAAGLRVAADWLEERRAMIGITAADWLRAEAERAEAGEP